MKGFRLSGFRGFRAFERGLGFQGLGFRVLGLLGLLKRVFGCWGIVFFGFLGFRAFGFKGFRAFRVLV